MQSQNQVRCKIHLAGQQSASRLHLKLQREWLTEKFIEYFTEKLIKWDSAWKANVTGLRQLFVLAVGFVITAVTTQQI